MKASHPKKIQKKLVQDLLSKKLSRNGIIRDGSTSLPHCLFACSNWTGGRRCIIASFYDIIVTYNVEDGCSYFSKYYYSMD